MRAIALTLIATFILNCSFAQNAKISGIVKDKFGIVSYTNIQVKGITDTTFSVNIWTDDVGFYSVDVFPNDKYVLHASAMGYKDFVSEPIHVTSMQQEYVLDVSLKEASEMLQELMITSKKSILEAEKGKLIFNVQSSAMTTGQTALYMLKKLPGVTVGQNDEILFRGTAGVNVMIDEKMAYLSGNQLANYLKGMSAEDLNKIELITTPPAEFDAAGNAGIINIIPKKSLKKGYAVDLRSAVSYGKFWMTNQSVSASLQTEKFGIYSSLDYNTPHRSKNGMSGNTITENGQSLTLQRNNEVPFKIDFYTWKIGIDWKFLTKHTIGVFYHGYFDNFRGVKKSDIIKFNNTNSLQSRVLSEYDLKEPYHYHSVNFNHQYEIDTLGKKITTTAHYITYRNYSDALMTSRHFDVSGNQLTNNVIRYNQPGFITIKTAQSDADLPFEKIWLKFGLKYAEVSNDNKSQIDELNGNIFVPNSDLSHHFKYKEQNFAGYFSATYQWNQTDIQLGLRLENTMTSSSLLQTGWVKEQQYTRLFPNFSLNQKITDDHQLNFNISRRINRPVYSELNPVRWYNDEYFYFFGNPELVPEMAWVGAFTYSLQNRYIFSATYNQSNNYIDRRLSIDNNGVTIQSISDNFGKRHRLDFTASVPFKPLPFWDIQFFTDLSYISYPISLLSGEKCLSLWATTTTLQQDFSLPNDFTINLGIYFSSSELRGIYQTKPTGNIDFGIKKAFLDQRLIAQLSVSDIFNTNRYRAYSQSNITDYYYDEKPYSRIAGLSLRYYFGGELIKSNHRKIEEQERL